MTYSDDFLEQLREACPMETIAGNYVNLIRRGRHYVCNCPFHSEKSPSCTIFPDTQNAALAELRAQTDPPASEEALAAAQAAM
mgnify:CR=1 FL=1